MMRDRAYTPLLIRWIQRAARNGNSADAIAGRFHCEVSFVREICRVHGITITGVACPGNIPGRALPAEQSTIGVRIANESLAKFEREAGRRGTSAALLAAEILNLIAADDLFAAMLD